MTRARITWSATMFDVQCSMMKDSSCPFVAKNESVSRVPDFLIHGARRTGTGKQLPAAFADHPPGIAARALNHKRQETPVSMDAPDLIFPRPLPTLRQVEDLLIIEAMKEAGENQSTAARLLGISRQTMIRKLKDLGSGWKNRAVS